jgi:hypothetical protein
MNDDKIEELEQATELVQVEQQLEDEQHGRALMLEEQVRFQNDGVPVEAILER